MNILHKYINFIKLLTINISILVFCIPLFGQEPDVDLEELVNGHIHKVDELLFSNLSFIRQTGNENQVTSFQEQQGKLSNFIEVDQLNFGNRASIEQSGFGHGTKLRQNGTGNEAKIGLNGNLTTIQIVQEGDGNRINSYINNQSGTTQGAFMEQYGNSNKIDFAQTGYDGYSAESLSKAAYISQKGNNLEVNAAFDSFNPVHIEQQSGPGGGGMQVNVSTSDFSFPMR